MSYLIRNLVQDITLWTQGTPSSSGDMGFNTPVKVKGRWEARTSLDERFFNSKGKEIVPKAKVYLVSDVALGDYLFQGISTVADPKTLKAAYRVEDFKKTPNLRADEFERLATV